MDGAEWGLILTALGLAGGTAAGVGALAVGYGMLLQRVRTLKDNDDARASELVSIRERLATGDTKLALLVDGMGRLEKSSASTAAKVDDINTSLLMMRDFMQRT